MESEGLVKKPPWCTPIPCIRAVGNPAQLLLGGACMEAAEGRTPSSTDRRRLTITLVAHIVHEQMGVRYGETGGNEMSRKTKNQRRRALRRGAQANLTKEFCGVLIRQRSQIE